MAFNKKRIADLPVSWHARKTALLIRNFAARDRASDALKIWNVMRCVVRFTSPLRVPDAVLIAEEKRMLEVVGTRSAEENERMVNLLAARCEKAPSSCDVQ